MASSDTGGVKPFSIQGRLARERERLIGMTDEERAWRRQWVKDQILSPDEPRYVPERDVELLNPIRRVYMKPLDLAFEPLKPLLGVQRANIMRWYTGKMLMAGFGLFGAIYYFKYNGNNWTRKSGWYVMHNRTPSLPGEPDFPKPSDRTKPSDYADRGFKNSPI